MAVKGPSPLRQQVSLLPAKAWAWGSSSPGPWDAGLRNPPSASTPKPPNSETEVLEGPKASLGAREASVLLPNFFQFTSLGSACPEASPIFFFFFWSPGKDVRGGPEKRGAKLGIPDGGPKPPAPSPWRAAERRGRPIREPSRGACREGRGAGGGRGAAGSPSSLTVHALERQESSALLHLYILLEGEGDLLQPCNDLLHPLSPAGATKSCSSPPQMGLI